MKQLQFELWKECNNNCTFCYLGKTNRFTEEEIKLQNIEKAIKILSDKTIYSEYDTVGFIGGEFFQGQLNTENVKIKFMELISLVAKLMEEEYIKQLWLCATLTIGKQEDLWSTLDLLKNKKGTIWVLTSYDTMGRFHTKQMEYDWFNNIKTLHCKYPKVKLNTTVIITGDLILKYLNNTFSFKSLIDTCDTSLFIKLCAGPEGMYSSKQDTNNKLGYFFPKRKDFLTFLHKFKEEENPELFEKLFNIKYRADTLLCEYKEENVIITRNKENKLESYNPEIDHIMKCGHLSIYNCYLDSNKCALCDKEIIEKL